MRSKLTTLLTVIGAVTVLVLAGNTVALATTGHSFLLGKANTANKMTTLKRTTAGTALNVRTKRSYNAPLATNGRGRVANLNADMVDGLHANSLKTKSYVFTTNITTATGSVDLPIPVPAGNYLISYSARLNGASSKPVGCYLLRTSPGPTYNFFGDSRFTAGTDNPGLTGSGYTSLPTGTDAALYCYVTGGTFTTVGSEPIQVVATKVDSVSTGTITPARLIPNARVAGSPK